ncbi:Hypothetical protein ACA1_295670 [Acanthamoeba castellanii str. Neff]|uniref:Uncharacterized protein n=1 Tax=Acanthamoeba castellanii (strain ATCC 30010 / Neff) TaxID=1257118 RepID=L8HM54_ACACF|nr:Hypothetical protein ACA1_295670 [Acanthamoeba castellanii str. Neff]ELR25481.1 Hypothetical protein ACA1_295670 [Acanthamoeba castellanii str. Neff]
MEGTGVEDAIQPKRERKYTATDWAEFFWTDFVLKDDPNMDDLLFFVPDQPLAQPVAGSADGGQQGSKFFVVRKHEDAEHKLPKRGDRSINWQETYFLNIITNHLKKGRGSTVTTPRSSAHDTAKRQRVETCVYASPTQVRMDMKEDEVTETYPTIFFAVNDFQEMLQDITVSEEGELVCVKLLATMPEGSSTSLHLAAVMSKTDPQTPTLTKKGGPVTIFSGAVGYEIVRQAFGMEAKKQNSPSTLRWLTRSRDKSPQQVFLNMKGPSGKGKAQMAVNPADSPKSNSWLNLSAMRKFLPTASSLSPSSSSSSSPSASTSLPQAFRCSLTSVLLPWASIIDDVYKTDLLSSSAKTSSS